MSNRNRTTLDKSVNDRELLMARVKEEYGAETDAGAIDAALRAALDHRDCLADAREELRRVAREASGTHYNVDVETSVERDGRAR